MGVYGVRRRDTTCKHGGTYNEHHYFFHFIALKTTQIP
ncbi:hypothetical protein CSC03_0126 [Enterobacter hormaechei]|nr:hypothetical protein CSC03_0126 [Enterobacter hormaechei]